VKEDGLDRLSDILVEDIASTPGDRLLAEAAEDHGDRHALAAAFDAALARMPARRTVAAPAQDVDHLADALCDDILRASEEDLLREVAQDHGGRRALAEKFDTVVAAIPSAQAQLARRAFGTAGAHASGPAARLRAFVRERIAPLGSWLSDLSFGRPGLAAVAALLLVAVITPGVYRSMNEPPILEPQTGPQISPQSGRESSPTVPAPQVGAPIVPTAVVEVLSVEKIFHKRFEGLRGEGLRRTDPYSREISQFAAKVRIKSVVVAGPGLMPDQTVDIRYDIETLDPPWVSWPQQRQLKPGETTTIRLRREGNVYWLFDSGREHTKAYLDDLERRYPTTDLR
jgi:hypothetical protein